MFVQLAFAPVYCFSRRVVFILVGVAWYTRLMLCCWCLAGAIVCSGLFTKIFLIYSAGQPNSISGATNYVWGVTCDAAIMLQYYV